jgi:hypothetical protein
MLDLRLANASLVTGRTLGAAVLLSVLCGVAPQLARADTAIAVDLEALVPIDAPDGLDGGPAFAIRIGQQLHLPLLTITPEIGFHHGSFADGPSLSLGLVGARVGIGELLRFGAFGHIGYGHLEYEAELGPVSTDFSYNAFTYDVGVFLDLTIIPLLDVGVHASYGNFAGDDPVDTEYVDVTTDSLKWLAFGVHAALIF